MQPEHIALGLAIRYKRVAVGISANDLALRLDVPNYVISRIENGKGPVDFIFMLKLVDVLGTSLEEILTIMKRYDTAKIDQVNQLRVELAKELKALKIPLFTASK